MKDVVAESTRSIEFWQGIKMDHAADVGRQIDADLWSIVVSHKLLHNSQSMLELRKQEFLRLALRFKM